MTQYFIPVMEVFVSAFLMVIGLLHGRNREIRSVVPNLFELLPSSYNAMAYGESHICQGVLGIVRRGDRETEQKRGDPNEIIPV
jgi:hypothetical protein